MTTTENFIPILLGILDEYGAWLLPNISAYTETVESAIAYRDGLGGADIDELGLTDADSRKLKATLLLVHAADTSFTAALRLITSGLAAESLGQTRPMLEVYALIAWANNNGDEAWSELLDTFFNRVEGHQGRSEQTLINKCFAYMKEESKGFKELLSVINNHGSHISMVRVMSISTRIEDGGVIPALLEPGTITATMCQAIELSAQLVINVAEEYERLRCNLGISSESNAGRLAALRYHVLTRVRSQLQDLLGKSQEEGSADE